jgi:hypothetical protein
VFDLNMQVLREEDSIVVPIGFGQLIAGRVAKVNSGLGAPGTQEAVPGVVVRLEFFLTAAPNGVVPGLIKIGPPQPLEPAKPAE